MKKISIANDFSVYPGGRIPDDGPYNGQKFRDDFIIPSLRRNEAITINFDNVRGYGSSFLEEAFGGLIRSGIEKEKVLKLLHFESSKRSIVDDVKKYINAAKFEVK